MADLIIDGTTYSGSPTNTANPQRPLTLVRKRIKLGRSWRAADGTLNYVHRSFKLVWEIGWGEKANSTTQAAVYALYAKTASFAFVDFNAASYTVMTIPDDEYDEAVSTNKANAYLFGLKIVLQEV